MLQRPDCGGHGKPADRQDRRRAGYQRARSLPLGYTTACPINTLPAELGKPAALVADTGYFSEANVKVCESRHIAPLIAVSREQHHPDPLERKTSPPPLKDDATALDKMRHQLKSRDGRALYAQRKCTVEPVIGIIKSALGFR